MYLLVHLDFAALPDLPLCLGHSSVAHRVLEAVDADPERELIVTTLELTQKNCDMYSFDFSKGAMLYLTYGKLKKSNFVKKAGRRSGRLSFQDFFIFIL